MRKDTRSETLPPAGGSQVDRLVGRVRINVGAYVGQDHAFGRWPYSRGGEDIDPDMVFDAKWDGRCWECRADGHGRKTWLGEPGEYGNGCIYVTKFDGVTMLDDAP